MASESESSATTKSEHISVQTTSKQRLDEADEALLVSNFVSYFQPLVHNIDKHVEALR